MPRPPAKAQVIAGNIAAKIVEGDHAPGSWLPAERALSEEYDADRGTVRRALRVLEDQGFVTLQPGVGAQVRTSAPVPRDAAADLARTVGSWRGFASAVIAAGREPFTRTAIQEISAYPGLAARLDVPEGAPVLERARIQGIVGEPPIQTATTWITWPIVEQLPILRQNNTGPGGLYARLGEAGYVLRYIETVNARLALPPEQQVLEVGPDQPVLTLWRPCYDQHDRVIEVTHRVIVGGRHELIYRYGPEAQA
jgi:GntR family transcriptional regulator